MGVMCFADSVLGKCKLRKFVMSSGANPIFKVSSALLISSGITQSCILMFLIHTSQWSSVTVAAWLSQNPPCSSRNLEDAIDTFITLSLKCCMHALVCKNRVQV